MKSIIIGAALALALPGIALAAEAAKECCCCEQMKDKDCCCDKHKGSDHADHHEKK